MIPRIGDEMLFVIGRDGLSRGRLVGNIGIKFGHCHLSPSEG